jgi:predicted nucleotidyltransferase
MTRSTSDTVSTRPQASDLEELRRKLRATLPIVRSRYSVTSLSLFGSRARGEGRADSDLDILVEFGEAPSLFRFMELETLLSEALQVRVDLVMRSALKPGLGRRILHEAIPV